jgi:hypothetical protein
VNSRLSRMAGVLRFCGRSLELERVSPEGVLAEGEELASKHSLVVFQ